jgi:D-hexose-6-phosphate mutarotase
VDAGTAAVHGLAGRVAEDNAAGGASIRLPEGPLTRSWPLDVAVRGTRGPVELDDGLGGRLRIACEDDGFDAMVIWNPGVDHGLADVPPDGSGQFLCIEPAALDVVTVAPQGVWQATARFTALVPDP